jgi:hypothetical protein
MKNKIPLWLISLIYIGLLTVLRLPWQWQMVWLWAGILLGLGLEGIDRWVYVYLVHPEEPLSVEVKRLVLVKHYREAMRLLIIRAAEQQRLVSRSILFLFGWTAVAVYVVTSTGSLLASGIVLGAGLHLAYDIATSWKDKEQLKGWLCWQIKRQLTDRELTVVVVLFGTVFGLLTLMM